ncbi:efflux RND transporter periplasmic adaptor subunit [Polaribacter septentrionalilitoris]|uniref:efflux RND transporter periplasmic adaptor subunit n=1 Tax=Polaribacter septentrionalilitoris TaxID=2494657 RepID=UPI001359EC9B|nr:efflux RND transporter periplasmic adaptor subunit [Polaribacter septentrionalilitoris]
MNKKKIAIILFSSILIIYSGYYFFFSSSDESSLLTTKVKRENFTSKIITSGEAQSNSLKKITGPSTQLTKNNIYNVKIQSLVPEGTFVKKGDFVGKLDPSAVNQQISDGRLNLESAISRFTQQKLDTTLSLKQERTSIKDLEFSFSEASLELKQSIYEPPSTIKKLENKLKKITRDLKEKKENYLIKKRQANAKMIMVGNEVSKRRNKLDGLMELLKSFTIYSDSNGMLTYVKEWNGNKKKVGSTITPWNPSIANLPDLSKMESKTYANEVDIRKVKKGLKVEVGFDAFPELKIPGVVTSVANVGERKRGSDIKVFQVLVKLESTNKNIKPGMTTSNAIITNEKKDVLTIPLETIFSKDTISYVYKKAGFSISKQQIEIGDTNNNIAIVKKGLNENDIIFLNKPEGYEEVAITSLKE